METKPYLIAGAGVAVAALAGVSYAMLQTRTPQPAPISQTSPTTTIAPTTTATPSTPIADKPPPSRITPTLEPSPITPASPAPEPSGPQSGTSEPEVCLVTVAIVDDPNPPLNVRSSPVVAADNVVSQLKNGTRLTVAVERGDWFEISEPVKGWVAKNRTDSGCNQKTARVRFSSGGTSATLSDRFVDTGTHQYLINANKGQTMTLTLQKGGLPSVYGPDGKAIVEGLTERNQTSWTGQLPQSGDYTLELVSNYKGYDYAFVVEVK